MNCMLNTANWAPMKSDNFTRHCQVVRPVFATVTPADFRRSLDWAARQTPNPITLALRKAVRKSKKK